MYGPIRRAEASRPHTDASPTKSIPAHAEIRLKILGPFLSVEDPGISLCAASRTVLRAKAKFYEGELSERELENLLMPMFDKDDVVLVEDPEGLVRWQ